VTAVPATASSIPKGRAGLPQALRSEWTKFWSVRSTVWSLAVTIVAVLAICVLATTVATHGPHSHVEDPARRSLTGFFLAQFAIGVLGVLVMSAEYGTGSIRSTLAAMPRRPVVLAAKVIVFGLVALVVSEALAFGAFFLGQTLLPVAVGRATLGQPGVARAVIGSGIYLALLGLFALGLGSIIRHTAGAIAAYAGFLLVLPIVVSALPSSIPHAINRYLPQNIGLTVITTRDVNNFFSSPIFGPWAGLAILAGYVVFLLVVGGWLMVHRDA
jgi:ABC-2 type transport system permease protein